MSKIEIWAPALETNRVNLSSDSLTNRFMKYVERYNQHHKEAVIKVKQVEPEQYSLEGCLRIHWGLTKPIQFQQDNRKRISPQKSPRCPRKASVRESYKEAITNGVTHSKLLYFQKEHQVVVPDFNPSNPTGIEEAEQELSKGEELRQWGNQFTKDNRLSVASQQEEESEGDNQTGVRMRKPAQRSKTVGGRINRRASINGHFYKAETSTNFLPPFGSDTTVSVTDSDTPSMIIDNLLSKLKIENPSSSFGIYLDKKDGAMHTMKETDRPLLEILQLDPKDGPKLFLMEKMLSVSPCDANANTTVDLTNSNTADEFKILGSTSRYPKHAVSDFLNLPQPMLEAFLKKYEQEERETIKKIEQKYSKLKIVVADRMENFVTHL